VDIHDANFYEIGMYLIGEEAKKEFAIPVESAVERAAFYAFLKELFVRKKAQLKFSEPGDWCDVNTAIDKIKAELLLKQKVRSPIASHRPSTHASVGSTNFYNFLYYKKKTTEIIVEPNILKHLWEHEIIPPASAQSTHYLITDTSLYELVGNRIVEGFNARGYLLRPLIVPLGETVKKIEEYWRLILDILAQGVDRYSIIINLGGGTINNVAGFVASTLFRGISLYHIPTTLLAQLDSTIDIKQAINTPYGKNLVGSFYAADKVIVDPSLLTFLPEDHIANGLSESIKHGLVQDKGLLDYYDQYSGSLRDPGFLEKIINWTIELKVKCMVNEPDGDHSEMIKDYGHSIGHALEQYSGYEIHHGRAIAVGMCVSAEIARLLNVTTDKEVDMHYKIFSKYGLTACVSPDANIDDFLLVLKHDKTYMQGSAYMGLISELGCLWHDNGRYAIPVDLEIVLKALAINQRKSSADQEHHATGDVRA
jgi:3-dehydroquinate synthase